MTQGAFECVFQMRLSVKMLERQSKKAATLAKKKRNLVAAATVKGDEEKARIHGAEAVRLRNESLAYLRMAARIEAVRSVVERMNAEKQLVWQLGAVAKSLEQSMQKMSLTEVSALMDKFRDKEEDLQVLEHTVNSGIDQTTASMAPTDEVDELIRQTADEYSLQLEVLMPALARPKVELAQLAHDETLPLQSKQQTV